MGKQIRTMARLLLPGWRVGAYGGSYPRILANMTDGELQAFCREVGLSLDDMERRREMSRHFTGYLEKQIYGHAADQGSGRKGAISQPTAAPGPSSLPKITSRE